MKKCKETIAIFSVSVLFICKIATYKVKRKKKIIVPSKQLTRRRYLKPNKIHSQVFSSEMSKLNVTGMAK